MQFCSVSKGYIKTILAFNNVCIYSEPICTNLSLNSPKFSDVDLSYHSDKSIHGHIDTCAHLHIQTIDFAVISKCF